MLRPLIALPIALAGLVGLATHPRVAAAEACSPAVVLAGDPQAIATVAELLSARGVALEVGACGAVKAQIERRGEGLAIVVEQADGTTIERVVGEAQTAATVIESFTHGEMGDPLLASRAFPREVATAPNVRLEAPVPRSAAQRSARGVQLFSAFETSYASDRTSWIGAHLGACVMLGPVCAAARLRLANVEAGPGPWNGEVERRSIELLVGIDIPFALGGWTFSPGFATGLGQMHTRGATQGERAETGGLRADVHATLSIPLAHRLAIDVFTAAELTQETHIEWGAMMTPLPDEPRVLARLGVGLRYGGL